MCQLCNLKVLSDVFHIWRIDGNIQLVLASDFIMVYPQVAVQYPTK